MATKVKKTTKRNTNPGVRIVGRRIYDSKNGKSCHQCRQKTMDFVATCKAMKKKKKCLKNFCHKCLSLRYGEIAEEVEKLPDWICPECRDICICSICLTRRGLKPTGILAHKAKACGYASVLELLQAEGFDKYAYQKKEKLDVISIEGSSGSNESVPETEVEVADVAKEKPKQVVRKTKKDVAKEKQKQVDVVSMEVSSGSNESVSETEMKVADVAKEKPKQVVRKTKKDVAKEKQKQVDVVSMECISGSSESVPETEVEVAVVAKEKPKQVVRKTKKVVVKEKPKQVVRKTIKAKATNKLKEEILFEVPLPQGISLTSVSGIDIPSEEAGNVCQLFEFCSAFGKALGLMEGEAETVVRELFVCGRNTKRQQYSLVIQMMIHLLNLISQDREMSLSLSATDNSWFTALGEILLESEVSSDEFPPETFKAGVAEYKKMDASKRLKLLNFLCDESLTTWAMRDYITGQTKESENQKKEAKQKAAAAKEKEKQLKQKLQSDVAKDILEKNGAPLSIEEHNSILSQIKAEVKEAHEEMMAAKGMASGATVKCDVLGTDPIMIDDNGLVLWKLNSYKEEPSFLLQDLGTFDHVCPHEKWLTFKPEQKQEIEKYISYKMKKLMQTHQKNANVEP